MNKNITMPLVKNGVLDPLLLVDMQRRLAGSAGQQKTISATSKSMSLIFNTLDIALKGFCPDIETGSRGKVVKSSEAENSSVKRNLIQPLKDLAALAELAEAHTILMPLRAGSEEANIIQKIASDYRIQAKFSFRSTPYNEDLSVLGPISPRVVDNMMCMRTEKGKPLSRLLYVDPELQKKWKKDDQSFFVKTSGKKPSPNL